MTVTARGAIEEIRHAENLVLNQQEGWRDEALAALRRAIDAIQVVRAEAVGRLDALGGDAP
jgi:hypothetical protein